MSSERWPDLDPRAVDLLFSIVETSAGTIPGEVLDVYFSDCAHALKNSGLLEPAGHISATASQSDFEDEPIHLHWSDERGGYGYFSPTVGWVTVPNSKLLSYRLRFAALIEQFVRRLDWNRQAPPRELVPDLLWEIGEARLPGRTKRVPVWIARRLSDPAVWQQFASAARLRPAPSLRIVLSFTGADRVPVQTLTGHEIIAIVDVAVVGRLAVDPEVLAARLRSGSLSDDPIALGADGAAVLIRGKQYVFRGSKQRAAIRRLYEAWKSGRPVCLTAEVLEQAGFSRTVNTLAKAFSGRSDWREFISEDQGRCWMFA